MCSPVSEAKWLSFLFQLHFDDVSLIYFVLCLHRPVALEVAVLRCGDVMIVEALD
jgi:hypothetical protein